MTRERICSILLLGFSLCVSAVVIWPAAATAQQLGQFQQIETETLDEEDFVFPDDFGGESLNIVMLAMSKDQDNGTWQGDELVEWYAALEGEGVLSEEVKAWHFSVMKVPFFVKGLIRGGLADSYAEKLPADQAAAIFVKDIEKFAAEPGIELDGQPTIVLVAADGELLQSFKGEASAENVAAVDGAVKAYVGGADAPPAE